MKHLLQSATLLEILTRVAAVEEGQLRMWGTMSAHEMICHMTEYMQTANGSAAIEVLPRPVRFVLRIFKPIILRMNSIPKNARTAKGWATALGEGLQPSDFERDQQVLLHLVRQFRARNPKAMEAMHPFFGPVTNEVWARMAYIHFDHHLRQFGH
ncbi:hypothetical protein BH10BAC6_BH10BAC6_14950 [soil metagenome]